MFKVLLFRGCKKKKAVILTRGVFGTNLSLSFCMGVCLDKNVFWVCMITEPLGIILDNPVAP